MGGRANTAVGGGGNKAVGGGGGSTLGQRSLESIDGGGGLQCTTPTAGRRQERCQRRDGAKPPVELSRKKKPLELSPSTSPERERRSRIRSVIYHV